MEKEGWGGEGRIYNIKNDIGIIILRLYTARRVPPQESQPARLAQPEASLVMAEKKTPNMLDTSHLSKLRS